MALIVLRRNLSENKKLEDIIPWRYLETDACYIDLSLIFLFIFVV